MKSRKEIMLIIPNNKENNLSLQRQPLKPVLLEEPMIGLMVSTLYIKIAIIYIFSIDEEFKKQACAELA